MFVVEFTIFQIELNEPIIGENLRDTTAVILITLSASFTPKNHIIGDWTLLHRIIIVIVVKITFRDNVVKKICKWNSTFCGLTRNSVSKLLRLMMMSNWRTDAEC